ncbi:BAHD family acyltransferase, clade V [Selaginella moellendorffii]|uniref:BAHD family acyltransferase, clade V n=1 Tax=Selaginella moellendorffii TaxID=88036 RepID=D8RFF4_SELML|nr:fatty alcohol:caffeoyl-CoA acyltransferase isoform X2 [Selaginella moellendorffii]XP_024530759.1 fatty alcohol:caffeoyl-CoA acyltransferase isoform X2 [Selaginella moellendorffii]EFJ29109.1 BAHD family acyltransferase, clade V [Selaginella moellendorffii]|eukprot:XP_002969985.1 fatty alcohol:caffeoyl-CoA acyltransferase isoform X2 [Selaginella moellendorffii]
MGVEEPQQQQQQGVKSSCCVVNTHEPILVPPAKSSSAQHKDERYFLTNLDQNLAVIMQTVYFYKGSGSSELQQAPRDPVDVVKKSLEEILILYYPLAGRLALSRDMKLEVLCNDQGALFVEADANVSLEQFVKDSKLGQGLDANLRQFVYSVPGAKSVLDIPPLVAQVTRFQCGGFVLGLSLNHAIFDGIAAMEFVNSWSELARGVPLSVPPCLDRSSLRARNPLQIEFPHPEFLEVDQPPSDQPAEKSELVFKSIAFDEKKLSSLKEAILREGVLDKCSSFEAFTALVWKCRTMATSSDRLSSRQTKLLFAVDARNRLSPALPRGYVGNGILLTCALTSVEDLLQGSLSHAIELIRAAIAKIDNAYLRSVIDFFEQTRLRPSLESTLVITTWSRLAFHTTDFGWGTPLFTAPASLPEAEVALFLPHGESRKGFELVHGLPERDMKTFVSLMETSWI